MGQITATRNLVATKVVRLAGQWTHDDVIKWKHFSRYWPFVRGIHRSQVNFPHKGQWCGALMFSLICAWNCWVNNRQAGDLRCHRVHFDVIVMGNPARPVIIISTDAVNEIWTFLNLQTYPVWETTLMLITKHVLTVPISSVILLYIRRIPWFIIDATTTHVTMPSLKPKFRAMTRWLNAHHKRTIASAYCCKIIAWRAVQHVIMAFPLLKIFISFLTPKHRETHGCVANTVTTDALVLKHQAISINNAD